VIAIAAWVWDRIPTHHQRWIWDLAPGLGRALDRVAGERDRRPN
jgi:hypothetical protein